MCVMYVCDVRMYMRVYMCCVRKCGYIGVEKVWIRSVVCVCVCVCVRVLCVVCLHCVYIVVWGWHAQSIHCLGIYITRGTGRSPTTYVHMLL